MRRFGATREAIGALIVFAAVLLGSNARADPPSGDDPYIVAAHDAGVPLQLLVAIAGAESGYHPFALNIHGREILCRSREEAERILMTEDNVDIGLMQINWPFWGPRLGVSKFDLLDPRINLHFGARILRQALEQRGNIWDRISNYHAGTASTRQKYNERVYSAYLKYLRGQVR